MSESKQQRKWVREEVVILVTEYFRTKNWSSEEISEVHQMFGSENSVFRYAGDEVAKRNSSGISAGFK